MYKIIEASDVVVDVSNELNRRSSLDVHSLEDQAILLGIAILLYVGMNAYVDVKYDGKEIIDYYDG